MKNFILYLVSAIFIFLLPFCSSEEEEKFCYVDFDPDLVVQSNDSLDLDLNSDACNDLRVNVGCFETSITHPIPMLRTLNSLTFIDCGDMASASLITVQLGQKVSNKSNWITDSHYMLGLLVPEYEVYIAFKFVDEVGAYYGWMKIRFSDDRILYIDEYAYNKTANESILTGQLQAHY
jgi:hypothetical protein